MVGEGGACVSYVAESGQCGRVAVVGVGEGSEEKGTEKRWQLDMEPSAGMLGRSSFPDVRKKSLTSQSSHLYVPGLMPCQSPSLRQ